MSFSDLFVSKIMADHIGGGWFTVVVYALLAGVVGLSLLIKKISFYLLRQARRPGAAGLKSRAVINGLLLLAIVILGIIVVNVARSISW
jgi:hypothetical protein